MDPTEALTQIAPHAPSLVIMTILVGGFLFVLLKLVQHFTVFIKSQQEGFIGQLQGISAECHRVQESGHTILRDNTEALRSHDVPTADLSSAVRELIRS